LPAISTRGGLLDTESGLTLAKLADRLCDEWSKPDAGLWELGDQQRYTSSLINSWNALDCACHLAEGGEMPDIHLQRWKEERALIHSFADEHCWSDSNQSYTFYAGTEDLDAATLLAARCGFLAPDDPRLWSTIDAIRRELTAEGPLLYRYTAAAKEENAFVACTFWMIEALSIAGRKEEAGPLLDGALALANDLGLWSEEIDPIDHQFKGNFPIGISHLAVIGAITSFSS
jgi:GH15 family glucan-1,4-alpha-glucosidase